MSVKKIGEDSENTDIHPFFYQNEILLKNEFIYASIFDCAPNALIIMDTEYNILKINKKFENISGFVKDEVEGKKSWHEFVSEFGSMFKDINDINFENRNISSLDGSILDSQYMIIDKFGNKKYVILDLAYLPNTKLIIISLTEITNLKNERHIINDVNNNLKLINKILRHDFLNNLTVISMSFELLEIEDSKFKDNIFKYIQKSFDLVDRMREFESFIVSGDNLFPIDIKSAFESVIQYYKLEYNISGDCKILADDALYPVFDNLIRNSLFHGKASKINIDIEENETFCEIKYIDNGIGINSDIIGRIFEKEFSYGKDKGTGLGLYIIKRTIERWGGDITVESNKNTGTTFIITLKPYKN